MLCLTQRSTIFQLYRGGQFYWWRKPCTRRKSPSCRKTLASFITILYRVLFAMSGIRTHNF